TWKKIFSGANCRLIGTMRPMSVPSGPAKRYTHDRCWRSTTTLLSVFSAGLCGGALAAISWNYTGTASRGTTWMPASVPAISWTTVGSPVPQPRLALLDLNRNSLHIAARRLVRYRPEIYRANVLEPLSIVGPRFDSNGVSALLHCLPGTMRAKAVALDHLKALLNPGGV